MFTFKSIVLLGFLSFSTTGFASTQPGKYFDRAIFVIFENTDYANAMKQPFFKKLANDGALFSNLTALTHPSQPNYIALTSGSTNGVRGDGSVDVSANNIVDLLEAQGVSWKVYAEDYPGNCFTAAKKVGYVRKHNPFISFMNIQKNPARCSQIVNANQFELDATNGTLPSYVFYIPNMDNDGHDTNIGYADKWYSQKFSKYVSDSRFMAKTILISTFDEDGGSLKNQIYTSIVGFAVNPGVYSNRLTQYSLLNLIEENWSLGSLTKNDAQAAPLPNIWKLFFLNS
jgi:hypothetical protein